jgi:hypothetical protein
LVAGGDPFCNQVVEMFLVPRNLKELSRQPFELKKTRTFDAACCFSNSSLTFPGIWSAAFLYSAINCGVIVTVPCASPHSTSVAGSVLGRAWRT